MPKEGLIQICFLKFNTRRPTQRSAHSYPQILWGSGKGLKFVKGGYLCKRRKHMDKKTWAMAEFGKAELGDARLTKDWYQ